MTPNKPYPETNENYCISTEQINQCIDIDLQAVPIAYEVRINEELVYSFNNLENARLVYNAIRCDLKGAVYHAKS